VFGNYICFGHTLLRVVQINIKSTLLVTHSSLTNRYSKISKNCRHLRQVVLRLTESITIRLGRLIGCDGCDSKCNSLYNILGVMGSHQEVSTSWVTRVSRIEAILLFKTRALIKFLLVGQALVVYLIIVIIFYGIEVSFGDLNGWYAGRSSKYFSFRYVLLFYKRETTLCRVNTKLNVNTGTG
jgi:hypothetical protein